MSPDMPDFDARSSQGVVVDAIVDEVGELITELIKLKGDWSVDSYEARTAINLCMMAASMTGYMISGRSEGRSVAQCSSELDAIIRRSSK